MDNKGTTTSLESRKGKKRSRGRGGETSTLAAIKDDPDQVASVTSVTRKRQSKWGGKATNSPEANTKEKGVRGILKLPEGNISTMGWKVGEEP